MQLKVMSKLMNYRVMGYSHAGLRHREKALPIHCVYVIGNPLSRGSEAVED
jgi:hypothetical protein